MRMLIAAFAAFFVPFAALAQSTVATYEERPVAKTLVALQFQGDPVAATQALRAERSRCRVHVDPVDARRFLVAYGQRLISDNSGRRMVMETRSVPVRVGDYIVPSGPNSCDVVRKARFEQLWAPVSP